MRCEGSVLLVSHGQLKVSIKDTIDISTGRNFSLVAEGTGRINGGKQLDITGRVVRINGGSKPTAHVGSVVECRITVPLAGTCPSGAVVIPLVNPLTGVAQTLKGIILSGNASILV